MSPYVCDGNAIIQELRLDASQDRDKTCRRPASKATSATRACVGASRFTRPVRAHRCTTVSSWCYRVELGLRVGR